MISKKIAPIIIESFFKHLVAILIICYCAPSVFSQDIPFYTQETLILGSDYSQINAIAIADYDSDNDQDILVLDKSNNTLNVLENDGNGNFDNAHVLASLPDLSFSVTDIYATDYNGDGLIDIQLSNYILIQDENQLFRV